VRILRVDGALHFGNIGALTDRLYAVLVAAEGAAGETQSPATPPAGAELPPPPAPAVAAAAARSAAPFLPASRDARPQSESLLAAAAAPASSALQVGEDWQGSDLLPTPPHTDRDAPAAADCPPPAAIAVAAAAARSGAEPTPPPPSATAPVRVVYALASFSDVAADVFGHLLAAADAALPLQPPSGILAAAAGGPPAANTPPPSQPALRALILDASRVVDVDATAFRELQSVMELYAHSRLVPPPRLLITGLPGPARDTLSSPLGDFRAADAASTSFLSVAAALASLDERAKEAHWADIARGLADLDRPRAQRSVAAEAPVVAIQAGPGPAPQTARPTTTRLDAF